MIFSGFLVSRNLVVDVKVVVAEQSNGLRQLPQRTALCELNIIIIIISFISGNYARRKNNHTTAIQEKRDRHIC